MINGLARSVGQLIEQARHAGPFTSIDDFARRTGLGQAVVKRLAEADAFGSARRQPPPSTLASARPGKETPRRCRCSTLNI